MSLFSKIKHTFLTPKFLWKVVIRNYDLSKNSERNFFERIIFRVFWFWPTLYPALSWSNTQDSEAQGFKNFVEITDDVQCLLYEVVRCTPDLDSRIFDIGCNVGRCLNYLNNLGYRNLYGVDISREAIENIPNIFPDLQDNAHIELKTVQEYLLKTDDCFYTTTYTMGATVELIPSSFPLIKEITRITSKYVCFMISYNGHLYPRFWEYEFSRHSFILVKKFMYSLDNQRANNQVLLVFKRINY
jgi:SAM-dependent methyltransferase